MNYKDSVNIMTDNWRMFRQHHPVGAYLPVGQLDGDCSCGRGSWPCDELTPILERLFLRTESVDNCTDDHAAWREEIGADSLADGENVDG